MRLLLSFGFCEKTAFAKKEGVLAHPLLSGRFNTSVSHEEGGNTLKDNAQAMPLVLPIAPRRRI